LKNDENLYVPGRVVEFYNGVNYDNDCALLGYVVPRKIAEFALPYMKENLTNKEYQILDIGAGTGHISQELKNAGYKGHIDGMDGSADMLRQAESLYRDHLVHILTKDNPMPYPDESYDLVLSGGSIQTCMILPDSLKDFHRVCKKGGFIIFTTGYYDKKFLGEVDRVVDQLTADKKWILVEKKVAQQYVGQNEKEGENEWEEFRKKAAYVMIYCLKKL